MRPHKNELLKESLKPRKFKPKVMIGNLKKPICEFTSDLVLLAHHTRLVKRQMLESGTLHSKSLQQSRIGKRRRHKYQKLAIEEEEFLSQRSRISVSSNDSQLSQDVKTYRMNVEILKQLQEEDERAEKQNKRLQASMLKLSDYVNAKGGHLVGEVSEDETEEIERSVYNVDDDSSDRSTYSRASRRANMTTLAINNELALKQEMRERILVEAKKRDWRAQ